MDAAALCQYLKNKGVADGIVDKLKVAAPIVVDWARRKSNPMAALLVDELFKNGQPSQEKEMEYAIFLLPSVIQAPLRRLKRPSSDEVTFHFIQFHPASSSMESVLQSLSDSRLYHPVVVVLGCREDVNQVFVCVEGQALPVPLGVVSAVEKLLKLHFMLHMEFAAECSHILHFLQRTVLEVPDQLTLCRGAVDLSVYIRNKKRKT